MRVRLSSGPSAGYDRYVVCSNCDRVGWRCNSRRAPVVAINDASEPARRKNAEEWNARDA
jgi:hypothetical protein